MRQGYMARYSCSLPGPGSSESAIERPGSRSRLALVEEKLSGRSFAQVVKHIPVGKLTCLCMTVARCFSPRGYLGDATMADDLGQGLPVGRLQLHAPLRPTEAPMFNPDEIGAVEPACDVELGEVQAPRRPPDFVDLEVDGALFPRRPSLPGRWVRSQSRMAADIA